jgi:hypothetical protein
MEITRMERQATEQHQAETDSAITIQAAARRKAAQKQFIGDFRKWDTDQASLFASTMAVPHLEQVFKASGINGYALARIEMHNLSGAGITKFHEQKEIMLSVHKLRYDQLNLLRIKRNNYRPPPKRPSRELFRPGTNIRTTAWASKSARQSNCANRPTSRSKSAQQNSRRLRSGIPRPPSAPAPSRPAPSRRRLPLEKIMRCLPCSREAFKTKSQRIFQNAMVLGKVWALMDRTQTGTASLRDFEKVIRDYNDETDYDCLFHKKRKWKSATRRAFNHTLGSSNVSYFEQADLSRLLLNFWFFTSLWGVFPSLDSTGAISTMQFEQGMQKVGAGLTPRELQLVFAQCSSSLTEQHIVMFDTFCDHCAAYCAATIRR